ncbi:dihydroorotate dehydrogenase electron transfer subunit [Proteinivorax hydrogeniformans]|uniref:Dihydroorotate dehydrogenase electron transfer subunit n=1 Tax=Proteinivorax hydrogeniformans TaxID=1826727 RepID=A0AAU8HRG3_9FIRM
MLTGKIEKNQLLADDIFEMEIKYSNLSAKPGQFINVVCDGKLLPRPISVCQSKKESFVLVYKVVGEGTKWLSKRIKGSEIRFSPPLGRGFNLDIKNKKIAILGGGMGIAPILSVAQALDKADVFLGYNNDEFLHDKFPNKIYKSFASKGETVIDRFVNSKVGKSYDYVIACGPEGMLKALQQVCKEKNIPGQISIEQHMACGVGACLVCNCQTKHGYKLVCSDGPVFPIEEVVFND